MVSNKQKKQFVADLERFLEDTSNLDLKEDLEFAAYDIAGKANLFPASLKKVYNYCGGTKI